MNEEAKKFRKKIKKAIPVVLATSMLIGYNPNDSKANSSIAIEISDDKFEKILEKYIKNSNVRLTTEEENYIVQHIEEIVENLTNCVDVEILKSVNQNSDNYYNQVDYIRNEKLENFIVVMSNEGKKLEIEAKSKEEKQEVIMQDIISILVSDMRELKGMPKMLGDSMLEREGIRNTLKIAKDINKILDYGEIQYDEREGRIEIKQKEKDEKTIEMDER